MENSWAEYRIYDILILYSNRCIILNLCIIEMFAHNRQLSF